MIQKIQISSDTLYQFLKEHGVKETRIADIMGFSTTSLNDCFAHRAMPNGKPRTFTSKTIKKLNYAIEQMAESLRSSVLTFGSEQTYTNQWGNTYDPALLEPMKELGKLVNLTALVERVLGWNKFKKQAVFVAKNSISYGCISQDDVNRINAELLAIAGVLSSYEVVLDGSDSEAMRVAGNKKAQAYENRKRSRIKDTCVKETQPWDDASKQLLERYQVFHEHNPEDILLFRVNDGYTVTQDDSRRLCELCDTLTPYTDNITGLTTAYMDAGQFGKLAERCLEKGWRIIITDMYSNDMANHAQTQN